MKWRRGESTPPAKRVQFDRPLTPWVFLLPQLAVVVIFFYWPSVQAVTSSFYLEDPFGFSATFVGLDNYTDALSSGEYLSTATFTAGFALVVTALSLGLGLLALLGFLWTLKSDQYSDIEGDAMRILDDADDDRPAR